MAMWCYVFGRVNGPNYIVKTKGESGMKRFLVALYTMSFVVLGLLILTPETGIYRNFTTTMVPENSTPVIVSSETDKTIASGNCVDRASTILSIMKRKSLYFDKVEVAVSSTHCQAVLNTHGKRDFLALTNWFNIRKSISEFSPNTDLIYVSPTDFLAAVSCFKPSITKDEMLAFLDYRKLIEIEKNKATIED